MKKITTHVLEYDWSFEIENYNLMTKDQLPQMHNTIVHPTDSTRAGIIVGIETTASCLQDHTMTVYCLEVKPIFEWIG